MASSIARGGEDEGEDEEFEGFDDFTIASSWERFISEIEAVCRLWFFDGPKNLVGGVLVLILFDPLQLCHHDKGAECLDHPKNLCKVKSELKYGAKDYCLEFYFMINKDGQATEWDGDLHNVQLSFGVNDFLVISPLSASGVVLDSPESSKLLSAVAIALSNCGSNWPAFVPVHDPSRKAYIGMQSTGTIFTRRFDADRIGSQVPVRLMHMEGLYELFVAKFASFEYPMNYFKVSFGMKLTYRTPPFDDEEDVLESVGAEVKESEEVNDGYDRIKVQWDDDCPWAEWYSAEDPIKGFELITIWPRNTCESSMEMAELENASSFDAEKWSLYPLISPNMTDDSAGKFIGFASQLRLLVGTLDRSFDAKFLEDFVSAENIGSDNLNPAAVIPPPTVRDRVLKELFHDGAQISSSLDLENKNSRAIKGAPLESLFAQFCLQSLWFGNCNVRAIAILWIEFVREVRWCWEESQPLPRMPPDLDIDLSSCLIHQKLHLLAICIKKKNLLNHENHTSVEITGQSSDDKDFAEFDSNEVLNLPQNESMVDEFNSDGPGSEGTTGSLTVDTECAMASPDVQKSCQIRKGSAGIVGNMMLLHSFQKMHAPYTQDAPVMTEDMHEERLHAAEVCGDAFSTSGQLEREILSSDMSAFKAANPDAVFEDFIRWHSPGDWESGEIESGSTGNKEDPEGCNWPPRGRLSQRMSEHGNSWRKIWNDSPALPASEQKPLFDPIREGEKVLHYLETLQPHHLLEQMVCTAFKVSADTLNQTSFGNLQLMKTKLNQLYITLASSLRPLRANHTHDKYELIGDLRRLCLVFENIEKLLILASSLHRKLRDAPRLTEAIFNDYFNYYLPKMGNSSASICFDKKFSNKQQVNMLERDVVANLFPPPTANQSWRKVLSMGNLLNGHEPILREIIFSVSHRVGYSHYGSSIPWTHTEEIETHRMYVCGTSNDLQVALSVTSWD
ncbi:putative Rab3 GTPase-activating protein catalytic subunit [Dioscorea sansibarensis]